MNDGVGLEYLWPWLAAAIGLLLYILDFLALKYMHAIGSDG